MKDGNECRQQSKKKDNIQQATVNQETKDIGLANEGGQ